MKNTPPNYVVKIGESDDPLLVGGKGASLSRMTNLGLAVPIGLTITTNAWRAWRSGTLDIDTLYAKHVKKQLYEVLPGLGTDSFVSVRSGAPVSMPGMMDTLLWVGAPRGTDQYLHYLTSFVKASGLDETVVEDIIDRHLLKNNTFSLSQIYNPANLCAELEAYAGINPDSGKTNVDEQIRSSMEIVFKSWDSDKAQAYREIKNIPDDIGTACTIQAMVSARYGFSGVMLTRGEIEWVSRKQGDAVVDGKSITRKAFSLKTNYAHVYKELKQIGDLLEREYQDAMDIEFTYDGSKLFILQCRPVKRTPIEAMRLAVELYKDKVVPPEYVLNTPVVDDSESIDEVEEGAELIAQGVPINGKRLDGILRIRSYKRMGKKSIALRPITTTEDIDMMSRCGAVLTILGGPTCHAALVAREIGSTAVTGVGGEIVTNPNGRKQWIVYDKDHSKHIVQEGNRITILPDGRVYAGNIKTQTKVVEGEWSRELRRLQSKLAKQKKSDDSESD